MTSAAVNAETDLTIGMTVWFLSPSEYQAWQHNITGQPPKCLICRVTGKVRSRYFNWTVSALITKRFALLRPGLQAVRVHANYGRLFRHGTRRVELHAYSD
jgi:hypothetical protein